MICSYAHLIQAFIQQRRRIQMIRDIVGHWTVSVKTRDNRMKTNMKKEKIAVEDEHL